MQCTQKALKMPSAEENKRKAARETIDILHDISTILVCESASQMAALADRRIQQTDLDRHVLSYCVSLIENGINPEALAVR